MKVVKADVVVVGAGFGGLGTALKLCELGAKTVLLETLNYPGGCASTFQHKKYNFEAGATLSSGLGASQLFGQWNQKYQLGLDFQMIDPVVQMYTQDWSLDICSDRDVFEQNFLQLPAAPKDKLRGFWNTQKSIADILWPLFDQPELLPPFSLRSILHHIYNLRRYWPALRWIGRSTRDVIEYHGLGAFQPLRQYLDAINQITVQTNSTHSEALFSLAAADYFFRGAGHVKGGIGSLAQGVLKAIRALNGEVYLGHRAKKLQRWGRQWRVLGRDRIFEAPVVVLNLLPHGVHTLLDDFELKQKFADKTQSLQKAVDKSWGAAMLYFVTSSDNLRRTEAHHIQLIDKLESSFDSGNHVFCSVGETDELSEYRTVTCSTHVPMRSLHEITDSEKKIYISTIQDRMKATISRRAPYLLEQLAFITTASPRTFKRFTARHRGFVGGIPRTVGFHNYKHSSLYPRQPLRGLYLVGDSVMFGQSTLATALGGVRTAQQIAGSIM